MSAASDLKSDGHADCHSHLNVDSEPVKTSGIEPVSRLDCNSRPLPPHQWDSREQRTPSRPRKWGADGCQMPRQALNTTLHHHTASGTYASLILVATKMPDRSPVILLPARCKNLGEGKATEGPHTPTARHDDCETGRMATQCRDNGAQHVPKVRQRCHRGGQTAIQAARGKVYVSAVGGTGKQAGRAQRTTGSWVGIHLVSKPVEGQGNRASRKMRTPHVRQRDHLPYRRWQRARNARHRTHGEVTATTTRAFKRRHASRQRSCRGKRRQCVWGGEKNRRKC